MRRALGVERLNPVHDVLLLLRAWIGFTDVVKRASARADESSQPVCRKPGAR